MKKVIRGKRIISILLLVCMLCTVMPTIAGGSGRAAETLKEEEKLLYGYDVTSGKNLMEPDALQTAFPIIDPQSDYLSHAKKIEGTKQTSQDYSSSSLSQVAEDFAQNISAEAFGRIYVVDADVSTSFDLSKHVENIYSQKYELYSTSISRCYYIVQLNTEEVRNYLSSQFSSDISSVKSKADAKKLFEKYGTHLNTGYTFGGRMNITNYMTTSDATVELSRGLALKEKVSAVISKVQAGESASLVEQYSSIENDGTSTSTYKFESYGGEATSSLTLDGLFTYNASYVDGNNAGFMYTRWINSINEDKNLSIIGIPNGANSIPLWDLLDSSSENYDIRQLLIETYIELCGDAYNDFMGQYSELVRVSDGLSDSTGVLPTLNGAYIRTPNDYYYYVDGSDFSSSGEHYGVHKNEYIYFDLTVYGNNSELSFECQNCEIIDAQSAVFKITGTSGNAIITVSCGDKKADLIKVPIQATMCEGGMGNETYPYIITNSSHFSSIPKSSSSCYTLYNDIDFGGKSISCLGNFSGVLDGNYCAIKNFVLESSKEWGLFNKNIGTIKNLKIENAGSSTNYSSFSTGGLNYEDDCVSDSYKTNSVEAINAGLICATNAGTIDNCYVVGAYIRNIIKNDISWFVNSSLTMNTGVIAGINSGTITDCMVKDIYLLGSFVNQDENTLSINVYTGGLAGQITGGSISSCVVDTGTSSQLMAQVVNLYSKKNADALVQAYSGGIAGYSNTAFSMNNSYVYVRNAPSKSNYTTIDAEYTFSSKGWLGASWLFPSEYTPKSFYALKGAVIVHGTDCEMTSSDNYVYSADSDVPELCIKPSGKNGKNSDKNSECFSVIDCVSEKKIDSEANYNLIGLSEESFFYSGASNSTSHITHLLSKPRTDYMKLVIDSSNQSMDTTVSDGTIFTPKGIELTQEINADSSPVKVFSLKVLDGSANDVTDSKLSVDSKNKYQVEPSVYSGQIAAERVSLTVIDIEIVEVSVVDDEELYTIYFDEREQYIDSWDASCVKLEAQLSNGEVRAIEDLSDSDISILTKAENIVRGDNIVSVQYKHDGELFDAAFILSVKERKIDSISIAEPPSLTSYLVGDTVKLDGLAVDVNYETGDSVRLSGAALDQLEVIGQNVVEGKNTVTVLYDSYDYSATFEVEGKKAAASSVIVEEEKSSGSTLIYVIAGVIVACAAVGAVCLILAKKKKSAAVCIGAINENAGGSGTEPTTENVVPTDGEEPDTGSEIHKEDS